jgi:arginyl-tRNA synthetase
MSKMYAEGAKAYKDSESAKAEINKLAEQSFTLDDSLYKEVYETAKQWSFEQIDGLVTRLGNKPIEKRYLESEADALGVKTVRAHVGAVFIESDGALVFPGSKYGSFDNVFVSSNGRGLYGARDLGLMQLKNNDYHADKSYIVTAEEQRDYFNGVIKAAELCLPELKDVTVNIPHGTVKLSTGKMSSRSGDVIEVSWLFDQIEAAIKERGSSSTSAIMTSAMRYQFLKVRIGSDVIFDVNEAASIQGNSGPYLQYAHARACSVLAKASNSSVTIENLTKEEHQLLLKTSEFNEVFERSVTELMPHHICTYLYELTQEFNRFYEKNRVIGDEREAIRLALLKVYVANLRQGLILLGVPAIESM